MVCEVVSQLHLLEQVSSTEHHIGTLAEKLLETMRTNPTCDEKVYFLKVMFERSHGCFKHKYVYVHVYLYMYMYIHFTSKMCCFKFYCICYITYMVCLLHISFSLCLCVFCLSVCLSMSVCLSACLPACLSGCLFVCLSVCVMMVIYFRFVKLEKQQEQRRKNVLWKWELKNLEL